MRRLAKIIYERMVGGILPLADYSRGVESGRSQRAEAIYINDGSYHRACKIEKDIGQKRFDEAMRKVRTLPPISNVSLYCLHLHCQTHNALLTNFLASIDALRSIRDVLTASARKKVRDHVVSTEKHRRCETN